MTRIAILDYGMGNLRSVEKAVERVGAEAVRTPDPEVAEGADGLILPGVGAFAKAMERVRKQGLDELVDAARAGGPAGAGGLPRACSCCSTPRRSSTAPRGLGLLPGPVGPISANGYKVPHIGWSPVRWERPSRLTEGLGEETPFYFVHSFVPRPGRGQGRAGNRRVRRALRLRGRAAAALRGPVPPREVERGGPADARAISRASASSGAP